jgi:mxaD protein
MKLKHWFVVTALGLLAVQASAAVAPSQQKVIKEVTVQADPAKAWELVKDFGAIHKWHPAVASTQLEMRKGDSGADVQHRLLTLKDGGTILEKLVGAADTDMKLEYRIVEGVLPVSGYRAIMQVKAGAEPGQAVVTWTGRFYNKAYAVDAPKGEDNATAIAAVEGVYDAGLAGLKQVLEAR